MKVQAAAISVQDKKFVVMLVGMDLVQDPGEATLVIDTVRPAFAGAPVVLVAQNDLGSPTFYGDEELVKSLAGIPIEEMPWKEYSVGG